MAITSNSQLLWTHSAGLLSCMSAQKVKERKSILGFLVTTSEIVALAQRRLSASAKSDFYGERLGCSVKMSSLDF